MKRQKNTKQKLTASLSAMCYWLYIHTRKFSRCERASPTAETANNSDYGSIDTENERQIFIRR
jgi:hypothetical protein